MRLVPAGFVVAVIIAAVFVRWPAPRGRGWSLYQTFSGFAYLRRLHVEADKKIAALPAERLDQLAVQAQRLATTRASDNILSGSDVPAEFADLEPRSVFIKPEAVFIEFMGGLDHVGLVIRKSDETWSVYHYDEAQHEILLRRCRPNQTLQPTSSRLVSSRYHE